MNNQPDVQLDTLPVLPYVAHEILIALNSPSDDLKSVASIIAMEPGLTARIIAMANSAFFSGQRQVMAVEDAVIRLGLSRVRVMAATLLLADQFDPSRCPAFEPERYWFKSVQVAYCASRLAPKIIPEEICDAAYLGGLLHNIGLLVIAHCFPVETQRALTLKNEDPERSLTALERGLLGFDHHAAGQMLLTEWQLPRPVIDSATLYKSVNPQSDYLLLIQLVKFTLNWEQVNFDIPISFEPQIDFDEDFLARVARECSNEREQLHAFAELLS